MPNYLIGFQHLDKEANTRLNSVVVAAESEQEAVAALHASTWERVLARVLSVSPTELPAEELPPLRRMGRPRQHANGSRRRVTLELPADLLARIERTGDTLTDYIAAAIAERLERE